MCRKKSKLQELGFLNWSYLLECTLFEIGAFGSARLEVILEWSFYHGSAQKNLTWELFGLSWLRILAAIFSASAQLNACVGKLVCPDTHFRNILWYIGKLLCLSTHFGKTFQKVGNLAGINTHF